MRTRINLTFALVLVGAVSIAPAAALADNINFLGSGASSGDTLTTYSEDNYTVADTSGAFMWALLLGGDPAPSIYTTAGGTITVTHPDPPDLTADFYFTGVDLNNVAGALDTYTITGDLLGVQAFTVSGTVASGGFVDYGTAFSEDKIDSLTITLTQGGALSDADLDNIGVDLLPSAPPTPEPSSLILAGSGMLALATALRRRVAI